MFDPSLTRDHAIVAFVGAKSEKKTDAIVDFLWNKQHIQSGIFFFDCDETESRLMEIVPQHCCFRDISQRKHLKLLSDFSQHQRTRQKQYKTSQEIRQKAKKAIEQRHMHDAQLEEIDFDVVWEKNPTSICLIENINNIDLFRDAHCFRENAMNGRHQRLFSMLIVENFDFLSTTQMCNVDYFVLFNGHDVLINGIDKTTLDELLFQYGCVVISPLIGMVQPFIPQKHLDFQIEMQTLFDIDTDIC